ncbi:MAG: PepSY domain-containing protein [Anaerolineae bacterium]
MKVDKRIAGAVAGVCLLAGSLGIGMALAQGPVTSSPTAVVQREAGVDDQVQEPLYSGSIAVDQTQFDGMSETDEAAALQKMATISADQAKMAAEAANPGATATKVELDNENGALVYSVELSNGLDVKVDAGNGQILHTEQAGEDRETSDQDNVQEEHGSQTDSATEVPGVEDAVGQ